MAHLVVLVVVQELMVVEVREPPTKAMLVRLQIPLILPLDGGAQVVEALVR
jgi:uncharacterized membrane protein